MTQRIVVSYEMVRAVEKEFMELYKDFRPQPLMLEDINMMKAIKKSMEYRRLMMKNRNNKHERPYSLKMYKEMLDAIPKFKFYYKNKQSKL